MNEARLPTNDKSWLHHYAATRIGVFHTLWFSQAPELAPAAGTASKCGQAAARQLHVGGLQPVLGAIHGWPLANSRIGNAGPMPTRAELKSKLRTRLATFFLQSVAAYILSDWDRLMKPHPLMVMNGLFLLNLLLMGPGCAAWRSQPGHEHDGDLETLMAQQLNGRPFWETDHEVPIGPTLTEALMDAFNHFRAGISQLRRLFGLNNFFNLTSLTSKANRAKSANWPIINGVQLDEAGAMKVKQLLAA